MVPRPATAPEMMPSTDGLPRVYHSSAIQVKAPAEAARCVAVIAMTARAFAAKRRAAVEAHPADPQQTGADHRQGQVVRRQIFVAVAAPLADDDGGDQPGRAGAEMDHQTAGEIGHADKPRENHRPRSNARSVHRPETARRC